MIILYAIPLGILLGLLIGGRIRGIGALDFRWGPLAVAGLFAQILLFLPSVSAWIGDLGPVIYVLTTGLVLVAVLKNLRIRGMALVAAGAASNLAAIVANGGYMPANEEAYATQGRVIADGYANTRLMEQPALAFLTDWIPLPSWLPFSNVVSIGDLLIVAGIATVLALAMRSARAVPTPGPSPAATVSGLPRPQA